MSKTWSLKYADMAVDSRREQGGLSVMDSPASLASSSLGIPLILLCLTEEHFLFSCVWALNFTQFRMLSTIPQFVAYDGINSSDITTTQWLLKTALNQNRPSWYSKYMLRVVLCTTHWSQLQFHADFNTCNYFYVQKLLIMKGSLKLKCETLSAKFYCYSKCNISYKPWNWNQHQNQDKR